MTVQNKIQKILNTYKTIAVVGLSRSPNKESYMVSSYLKDNGFKIIPINPFASKILGEKRYKKLLEIPFEIQRTIEIIDIFRPSADVPKIVEEAIKLKKIHNLPYAIWMQLNIVNDEAAKIARNAGFTVIMNRCMMIEHSKLFH